VVTKVTGALLVLLALTVSQSGAGAQSITQKREPLVVADQGSFYIGGRVVTNPGTFDPVKLGKEGETMHGDYAYVQYQIPPKPKRMPLVIWPGGGAYHTWESTPDGREGFRNIFLRRGWSVYQLDPPFRGRASRSTKPAMVNPEFSEKTFFVRFRLGIWPDFFPGVQFSRDPEALAQWWAARVPATGPGGIAATTGEAQEVVTDAVAALFNKTGPAILLTHSASGVLGWLTRIKTDNIKAMYVYEDTNFVFPADAVPPPIKSSGETVTGQSVPVAEFAKLLTIPIAIVYGDNIPTEPSKYPGLDLFRARREMCQKMVEVINARGGHAEIIDLPKLGIKGNTHFPMSDLNNVQVADLLSKWLHDKGLDN